MDGAEARDLYRSGQERTTMSRRAWLFAKHRASGGRPSVADLGGSSKYSNENFEGEKGKVPCERHLHMGLQGERPAVMEQCRQGKWQNGSVTSGKGLARNLSGVPIPNRRLSVGLLEHAQGPVASDAAGGSETTTKGGLGENREERPVELDSVDFVK
ncbi:hypothetical protein FNV43_RR20983 [Rhamnella rubrinervis]|uniref:Uncharacterized protein n=1 Tax=Rhamnella rubrinervis TaxID=2594499 RepID=A0A8K0GR01_9ROSA|nr:hypothetical protein FNV43_RR20983 [Rhamnella rubrinervis]